MSVQVNTYGIDDGIIGTLVLTLHDPASQVGTVLFRVTGADGIPSSPMAADRVPAPGVYEKDVPLALDTETLIEPVVTLAAGGTVPAEAHSFPRLSGQLVTLLQGSRTERGSGVEIGAGLTLGRTADGRRPFLTGTGGSGTGGTLAVQDADTTATPAGTLAFQGAVVSVANGVATFNLDGRYAQVGAAVTDSQLSGNIARRNASNSYGGYVQYADIWHSTGQGGFTVHGRDGTSGWHLYSVGNNLHFASYFSNQSNGVLSGAGDLSLAGSVYAGGGYLYGAGNAKVHLSEAAAQFTTGAGAALQARVGSLLVSDAYADAPGVPANGIRAKGNITSNGVVRALSGNFSGVGGAFCYLDNSYVGWYTSGNQALGTRVGSVLVSASYSDSAHVPANGIYTPNVARLGTVQGTAATQTAYDTLFLGGSAGVNFFLDRNVAGGQIIVGYNTPRSSAGQQSTFQIYSNASDRQVLFTASGAGATGGESWVSMPRGAALGPIRIASANDGYVGAIRRTDGGNISLQADVEGKVSVGAPASINTYKLNVGGDVYVQNGWLRTNGTQGWYNETYAGGVYMTDSTWVRTYNGKGFVAANVRAEQSLFAADPATRLSSDNNYWYSTSGYGLRFYGHDGAQKGFVYHDGGHFGLLDGGGNWTVRSWNGGGHLYGGWNTDGAFGVSRVHAGYDSGQAGSVSASNWFRSSGSTGWYNATHDTGIYAQQSGYVRTYGQSGIKVGSNALLSGNAVESDTTFGLYFGADRSPAYGVYRAGGAWSSPFPDLRIAFHTGIQIGANTGYGGTRFYSDSDMAAELMSVGNGDSNVRVTNTLYAGGKVSAGGGYTAGGNLWLDSTAHGSTVHGTHEYIHTRSAYGVVVQSQAGATQGFLYYSGGSFGLLHSAGGWAVRTWNGGVELRGRAQDDLGHPYAASLSGPGNPTASAREGTLYIQY